MNPSVEDLKLRAKLPDYSAGEGYVMVPFSDWTSALWLLGILERLEHLPETRAALAVPEPAPEPRWPPSENCYCGAGAIRHRYGTGKHCRGKAEPPPEEQP